MKNMYFRIHFTAFESLNSKETGITVTTRQLVVHDCCCEFEATLGISPKHGNAGKDLNLFLQLTKCQAAFLGGKTWG